MKSRTDPLPNLQAKLRECIDNRSRLGWLIDPITSTVHVYRARPSVTRLRRPMTLAGDPVLLGVVLDLAPLWRPDLYAPRRRAPDPNRVWPPPKIGLHG